MTSTTESRSIRSRRPGGVGQGRLAGPGHQVDRGDQGVALEGLAGGDDHRDAVLVGSGSGRRHGGPRLGVPSVGAWVPSVGGEATIADAGRRPRSWRAPAELQAVAVPPAAQPSRRRRGPGAGRGPARRVPASGWRRPGSRSRAGSTARGSPPTTGWPGSRSVGSSRRATPWVLGPARGGARPGRRPRVRQLPAGRRVGPGRARRRARSTGAALDRYVAIVDACLDRGMEPLVTLHHFTHPAWLGEDLWLRPDAAARYLAWAEIVVPALAPTVRHWVTLNEINVLALRTRGCSGLPARGGPSAFDDAAVARTTCWPPTSSAYEAIHAGPAPTPWSPPTTPRVSVYDVDRLLADVLLLPRAWASDATTSTGGSPNDGRGHYGRCGPRRPARTPPPPAGRPVAGVRPGPGAPGPARRRGPDGRSTPSTPAPTSAPSTSPDSTTTTRWPPGTSACRATGPPVAGSGSRSDRSGTTCPTPAGCTGWLGAQHRRDPGVPLWVVENGMCTRVRQGRPSVRLDGWDRPRYLREIVAAVVAAVDAGVPVAGYWHWSLVDNYEWGSYQPRFGLHGVDRHRGERGFRWLETDADGPGRPRRLPADHRGPAGRGPVGAGRHRSRLTVRWTPDGRCGRAGPRRQGPGVRHPRSPVG